MAECRRRVRLAVRADQLSRRGNRDAAERAWRRRQAQVSSLSHDLLLTGWGHFDILLHASHLPVA